MDILGLLPFNTERLQLRALDHGDAVAMLALYGDAGVMRHWCHAPWNDAAQARAAIDEALGDYAAGRSMHLAIALRDSAQLIGSCALYDFVPEHARATLGFLLAPEHWGLGYAGEAVEALLEQGFQRLGLNRVEAEVAIENDASARMLARLGFRYEGKMRARWMVAGRPRSIASYVLLREDWRPCASSAGGVYKIFPPEA